MLRCALEAVREIVRRVLDLKTKLSLFCMKSEAATVHVVFRTRVYFGRTSHRRWSRHAATMAHFVSTTKRTYFTQWARGSQERKRNRLCVTRALACWRKTRFVSVFRSWSEVCYQRRCERHSLSLWGNRLLARSCGSWKCCARESLWWKATLEQALVAWQMLRQGGAIRFWYAFVESRTLHRAQVAVAIGKCNNTKMRRTFRVLREYLLHRQRTLEMVFQIDVFRALTTLGKVFSRWTKSVQCRRHKRALFCSAVAHHHWVFTRWTFISWRQEASWRRRQDVCFCRLEHYAVRYRPKTALRSWSHVVQLDALVERMVSKCRTSR